MANSSISPEITTSRRIMEHITATIDYDVTNYLQLRGMGVGEFVSSTVFSVGGYDWEIRFYPDGIRDDCAGNASLYVHYLSQTIDVRAKLRLRMFQTGGEAEEVASFGETASIFAPAKSELGYGKFVGRSELESMSRRGDGCFTISCVLTVIREESRPLELTGHLERLLRDGTGADVTFSVGGREVRAHRCVLAARSPAFRKRLFGPATEKNTLPGVEVVDDVDPFIFEMMLHYIYTDSLPPSQDDDDGGYGASVMQRLLVAACKYGLD